MSEFVIERAKNDEPTFVELFRLLLDYHREEAYVPLDLEETTTNFYRALSEGMTFVARTEAGEAIGLISLIELQYWYSKSVFLQDVAFYVAPPHRGGVVGQLLLRAARDEGQARNKITYVTIHNPDRRPKRTRMSMDSQTLGFVPLGYTLKLN